ncbi:Auxin response factor 11 [Linum grandiflorum]
MLGDTSTHGGFPVRKINATECLPQLDISQPTPSQELVTKDLYGNEWRFKHMIFRGDNDELMVGVRRRASQQPPFESSLLSAQSISIAVLGTAYNAITGMNLFTVRYKPRSG